MDFQFLRRGCSNKTNKKQALKSSPRNILSVCHTITEDPEEHEEWTIKKLHMYNHTRRGVSITCLGECQCVLRDICYQPTDQAHHGDDSVLRAAEMPQTNTDSTDSSVQRYWQRKAYVGPAGQRTCRGRTCTFREAGQSSHELTES